MFDRHCILIVGTGVPAVVLHHPGHPNPEPSCRRRPLGPRFSSALTGRRAVQLSAAFGREARPALPRLPADLEFMELRMITSARRHLDPPDL